MNITNFYLVFRIAKYDLACPTSFVTEVEKEFNVYPLPGVPDYIAGVLSINKRLVTVIDLRKFFGLGKSEGKALIKTSLGDMALLFWVDEIKGLVEVKSEEIHPCPSLFSKAIPNYYLTALLKSNEVFIPVIDLAKIFSFEEIKPFTCIGKI